MEVERWYARSRDGKGKDGQATGRVCGRAGGRVALRTFYVDEDGEGVGGSKTRQKKATRQ